MIGFRFLVFIFESLGQGLLRSGPGRSRADGRSLPVVLSHLGGKQLPRAPRRRVRRPENPEPTGGRHVRGGDGVLRPRGAVRLSPADVDVGLLRLEFGSTRPRPPLLLLPPAPGPL